MTADWHTAGEQGNQSTKHPEVRAFSGAECVLKKCCKKYKKGKRCKSCPEK